MSWTIFAPEAARVYGNISFHDLLGYLPDILRDEDHRPAKEQIADRYVSGWSPFGGGQWELDKMVLKFPGDPPMKPVAAIALPHTKELCVLYPHQMVMVLQEDLTFEVVRLD